MTQVRKKVLSALLLVHARSDDRVKRFRSFFELWDELWPEHRLPQRKSLNKGIVKLQRKRRSQLVAGQNNIESSRPSELLGRFGRQVVERPKAQKETALLAVDEERLL